MEAQVEQAANEIKRLKACINNLISVQALPAIWRGGQPSQIVGALLDMLPEMLSLDFAYVRLKDSTGGAPLEMVRLAQDRHLTTQPQMIGHALNSWLGDFPHTSPLHVRNPIGDGNVSVLLLRLGLQAEMGVFVVGSKRADFPTQTERLLLNVAANQAAIGLQEARLLSEQKRVAQELDQSVAQRTSQLLAANEELEKEIAERKRTEGVLREQASLINLTHDTVFVRDMSDIITYWNHGAEERYGWASEEAVGRVSHELTQTTFPAPLEKINAELLETGRWEGELIHTRRDGTQVMVASRWALQRDEAHKPVAILETNNDITERKEAEQKLRSSEAFLAEGQRISHTGSWSWNVPSGKITWSAEHFRIFGIDPEKTEPSLQLFLKTVHPEDRSFIERSLDEAVREKSGFDIEFRIALGDGSIKHVQGVGRPVAGESGEVDRYVGTTVDITERKRGVALFAGEKRLLEMIATG